MASSVNHTVRLPRCRSASLYCAQFVTRRFGRGIWWRRSALYLCGMKARSGAAYQTVPYAIPPIRATRQPPVEHHLRTEGHLTAFIEIAFVSILSRRLVRLETQEINA